MADGAGDLALPAVIQREGVPRELGGRPGRGGVTRHTVGAEQPRMDLRLCVAGGAFLRRASKQLINVASGAGERSMVAVEHEDLIVVKVLHVARAIVTAHAVGAIVLQMLGHECRVVGGVAIGAGLSREGELLPSVAGPARERRVIVVLGVVDELKTGASVIELRLLVEFGGRPARRRVAGGAVGAEHACVGLRLLVAIHAWHRCVRRGYVGFVASGAVQVGVLTLQGKFRLSVIKVLCPIHAVVAHQTLAPKGFQMFRPERGVVRFVTVGASRRIELIV